MGFIIRGGGGSGTGTGGTTDHNSLTNRNIDNQHTINAIQGLQTELDKKVSVITGKGLSSNDYDNTAKNKVDNLNITQVVDLDAVKNASHTHTNTSVLGKIGEDSNGKATYNNELIFKNDADKINNKPAGNITASTVQAALNELDTKKLDKANAVSTYGYHYRDVAGYSTSGGGANTTGTLKITLPTSWTNTMLKIRLEGFNLALNGGNWWVELQGYNYQTPPSWSIHSATLSPNCPFTSVRFGHDGTKCCILLGTTGTVWQYPQITISDVYASYLGVNQYATGWSLSFITNETGFTMSSTPNVKTLVPAESPTLTGTVTLSGGQLQFPGTQQPSADPNTLDDYEEGTWTPTLYGSTTAGSYTLSSINAQYTKIGNIVHLFGYFNIAIASAGTGGATIGGLPFAKDTNSNAVGSIQIAGCSLTEGFSIAFTSTASAVNTIAVCKDAGMSSVPITSISTGNIQFSITYRV